METTTCYYGPAGWSYADWNGTVYPKPNPKGFNPLLYLAQDFDFMEVNTSFYRIPSLKLTEGWVQKTSSLPGFKFWVKLHHHFTHKGLLYRTEVDEFKHALSPLVNAGKLEGLLAQFPYSFKLNHANMDYLHRTAVIFNQCSLAVEFRHNSWNHTEVFDFFKRLGLIWVNIDQPVISQSLPLTDVVTVPERTYLRLHGRNYRSWFSNEGRDARYDYDYQLKELTEISETVRRLAKLAKKIFISGNNHYKGSAVKNLKELKNILLKAN